MSRGNAKTLLVLAASRYQLPVIRTARALGYRVVTTDNVPDNPGHALADVSYGVDTTDAEAVLAVARKERIDGIIAAATDIAVTTAAIVASELHLVAPPVAAARTLTNKRRFRRHQFDHGLASPRVLPADVKTAADIIAAAGPRTRWLVKPSMASGSKGVRIVTDGAELAAHLANSQQYSVDGDALVEELVEGSQHSCDGVLVGGRLMLSLITDRDVVKPPFVATAGHRVPSLLPAHARERALDQILAVLASVGVTEGPFDADFVWTGERAVVLELTPRIGGNSLDRLIRSALGFDIVTYAVQHACGDAPKCSQPANGPQPRAIVILGVDEPGILWFNESEAKSLRGEDWVECLDMDVPKGAAVAPLTEGRNRIGEALIRATDRAELDHCIVTLKQRLGATAIPFSPS